MSAEKLLIRNLLNNYHRVGKNGRPVKNVTHAVPVTFGMGLIQLDLDEKHKMLTLSAWAKLVSFLKFYTLN